MGRLKGRRFTLLAFDWDGTLVDSTALIAQSIQAACGDLGEPIPDEGTARYVIGLGLHSAAKHVAPGLAAADYPRLSNAYRRHYLAAESEIPLFDGAREMLAELAAAGHVLCVATGKSRAGLDHAIRRNALDDVFHATRCGDEGMPKPHPEMLQKLMFKLGVTPSQALMIGDTTHDLDLARNAGASALAVAYGAHDHGALARCEPLATVGSIDELRTWLRMNG